MNETIKNVSEMAKKINSRGEIHPVQLNIDKIQFLADKLFQMAENSKPQFEEQAIIIVELISSVAELFRSLIIGFVILLPNSDRELEIKELIKKFQEDCLNEIKRFTHLRGL